VISALLMSLRGSVCLYQGEELGLGEADLAFEDLQDPYGIRFWPEFKGRDGCRTPMVWDAAKPNGGFSTAKPWLPVARDHLPLAVSRQQGDPNSLLEHYRRFLAFRRGHPALIKGEIEFLAVEGDAIAFSRREGNEQIVCAFNLGSAPATIDLGTGREGQPLSGHGLSGKAEGGILKLQGYGAWFGRLV
jgi:alpha-glucosidase